MGIMYYKAGKSYVGCCSFFRKREGCIAVLEYAFKFLEINSMAPWVNFNQMMNEHLKGSHNHSMVFLVSTGFAVNLDVEKEIF